MTIAQTLLAEFDREMAVTRKVLERVPDDKWVWKAHAKSNTIGWNANHLAEIPGWAEHMLLHPFYDEHPVGGEMHRTPTLPNRAAVLEAFDRNVALGRKCIAQTSDAAFAESWSLHIQGQPVYTASRAETVRMWLLSHSIHHRAILTVYLRLNDVPVPGVYGPSGDEG